MELGGSRPCQTSSPPRVPLGDFVLSESTAIMISKHDSANAVESQKK